MPNSEAETRGCDQPAEAVAAVGALGHVAGGGLKHMEDAIEVGGKHGPPLFLGAVDEGMPAAAADAGIGEAAVDPAEALQRRRHRRFDRGGIADVANPGVDLAGAAGHGGGGVLVFLGVAAPDRDVTPLGRERLRDAESDAAIASGDDGRAAGEIEDAHERFRLLWRAFGRASDGGRCPSPTMDKPPLKIKYGRETEVPLYRGTK